MPAKRPGGQPQVIPKFVRYPLPTPTDNRGAVRFEITNDIETGDEVGTITDAEADSFELEYANNLRCEFGLPFKIDQNGVITFRFSPDEFLAGVDEDTEGLYRFLVRHIKAGVSADNSYRTFVQVRIVNAA